MSTTLSAQQACETLHETARLMREDPIRRAATLHFGAAGQLVVTGDMHGNLRNFEKLQRYCNLDRNPARSVILHELIHQEPATPRDPEYSIDLLLLAADWKCQFPDNVYFLQSNHELSQWRGHEITKGGRSVLHDFERGVVSRFGAEAASQVLEAVSAYVAALPLAARTRNGVFIAHSLPDPLLIPAFDATIFDRDPEPREWEPGGPAYAVVWGRFQTPPMLDHLARRLGVELFLVGHTPQDTGYAVIGRMIILASDHAHGVFLPLDLARTYTVDDLEPLIRKFVSVE